MRVVLDTNVLVSAALKQGPLPALAVRLAAERHTVLKSGASEAQLREVIARPYLARLIPEATQQWLLAVLSRTEAVTIVEQISACRDPTDDKFLELLTNGQGNVLVS